jgi:4'-phosphopantetheinyl transferase
LESLHVWFIDLSREPASRRRGVANNALRQILSTHLTHGDRSEIVPGEHGKPRLKAGGPEFNLSHSGEIALVALSTEHPVGVDVEQVQPARDLLALAERGLDAGDVEAVRAAAAPERPLVFYQRWTRHEARLKCLGVGIFRESMLDAGGVTVEDLEVAPGYAAAVAVEAPRMPPIRLWTFDPGALQKDSNRVS